jgi:hypothetical protein
LIRGTLEYWLEGDDAFLRGNALKLLLGDLFVESLLDMAFAAVLRPVTDSNPQGSGDELVGEIYFRCEAAIALGKFARDCGKQVETIRVVLARALLETNWPGLHSTYYGALLRALGDHLTGVPVDIRLDRDVDWQRIGPYVGRAIEARCLLARSK